MHNPNSRDCRHGLCDCERETETSTSTVGCSKADTELFRRIYDDLYFRASMEVEEGEQVVVDMSWSVWSALKERLGR